MTDEQIRATCHDYGIAVYQVGQVYDNAPPEFLKKYFVAITAQDDGIAVETIPLANSENEAYHNAYTALMGVSGT